MFDRNFDFNDHLPSFGAENTPKGSSLKAETKA